MQLKPFFLGLILLFFTCSSVASEHLLTLNWVDLIPSKERKLFNQNGIPTIDHNSNNQVLQQKIGSVRQELNGSKIKIPGFVIPLEGDDKVITEFFLVPYFGACIHVPPPPPNQIIYVTMPSGADIQKLWDVIYVVGTLKTKNTGNDMAQAGYILNADSIEPYDDQ